MTTHDNAQDVVEFLLAQHKTVRTLFDRIADATPTMRREPFETLVRMLAVHETAEEEVVYPVFAQKVPGGKDIANARRAEEDQAKKALSGLDKVDPASDDFLPLFTPVRTMVAEHAANEEREVFPALRQYQDDDMLVSMRRAVEAAEATAPTHPHAHAPSSAAGNLVMGPFVAIADRVRDALHKVRH
jgi:hemerythrin superfamily protein